MQPELYQFLSQAIFRLRWTTLAVVLVISFIMPSSNSTLPTWLLLAVFAAYNLFADILYRRSSRQFSFARLAIVDLPIAGLLYLLGAEPGGPLFVLLVLAVDSAASSLNLRGTLIYTGVVALLAAAIDVGTSSQALTSLDLRMLMVRLLVLALLGAAMAILTRRLALEQTLVHVAKDQAERLTTLNTIRADFIATVSHEIRTPLTAAQAALVLLGASAGERHRPDEQELLNNARRNIERLNVLISDLLTHNQLEAGTLQIEHQPCDLRAVVMDAMAAIYPLLQAKEQQLEVDLPEPLPVVGDPPRLEQVIVNLLANAHRHTNSGTHIKIGGCVKNDEIQLIVHDNGAGIAAEELEAIFQRFYRLGTTQDGSGLGLAIARRIVQLHNGRIWAESQPGAGTTFAITLPGVMYGDHA